MGNFVSKEVDSVAEGYGAEASGILSGDEFISINNKKVFISSDISEVVAKKRF